MMVMLIMLLSDLVLVMVLVLVVAREATGAGNEGTPPKCCYSIPGHSS